MYNYTLSVVYGLHACVRDDDAATLSHLAGTKDACLTVCKLTRRDACDVTIFCLILHTRTRYNAQFDF